MADQVDTLQRLEGRPLGRMGSFLHLGSKATSLIVSVSQRPILESRWGRKGCEGVRGGYGAAEGRSSALSTELGFAPLAT